MSCAKGAAAAGAFKRGEALGGVEEVLFRGASTKQQPSSLKVLSSKPKVQDFGDEGGGSKDSIHVHAKQEAPACIETTESEPGKDGLVECSTDRGLAESVHHDSVLGSTADNAGGSQYSLVNSEGDHPTLDSSPHLLDQTVGSQVEARSVTECLVNGNDFSTPASIVRLSRDLGQIDGSPAGAHSAVDGYTYGIDDSTPVSIARISRLYSLDNSVHVVPCTANRMGNQDCSLKGEAQTVELIPNPAPMASSRNEEVVSSVTDPMIQALQLALKSKGSRHLFAVSLPEHKKLVLDFLNRCWFDVSAESKCKFNSAFPSAEEDQGFSSDAYLAAFRFLVAADISQTHSASFSPEEEKVVFGFLTSLLKATTSFPAIQVNNRVEFLAGLHGAAPNSAEDAAQYPTEHEDTWQLTRSRRRQKSASKRSRTSHN